jgi:hypothetical protein
MADHIHGRINGKLTMIMGDINMKIWFLLLATGTLLCAGCATETAEQRDQRINRTLQAFMIQAQSSEEQISGKARKDWGPAEIAGYNALFLGAIQDWTQAEHRQLAAYDRMEPTARSTPAYVGGQSNYAPVSQPQVNISQPPREYVRRNAITGQLETVTEYGNGFQNVWPIRQ